MKEGWLSISGKRMASYHLRTKQQAPSRSERAEPPRTRGRELVQGSAAHRQLFRTVKGERRAAASLDVSRSRQIIDYYQVVERYQGLSLYRISGISSVSPKPALAHRLRRAATRYS